MAELTDEAKYVSSLDESSLAVAKSELHEDDKNRDGAVETLRQWLKQQPWLNAPTGTRYLLRYLRNVKFSQLAARAKLESCWTSRTKWSDWFDKRDPKDPKIQEIIKSGFILRMPRVDKHGRTVMLVRPGSLDIDKIKKDPDGTLHVFRTFTSVLDWVCLDERVQINGVVVVVDQTGITFAHKTQIYTMDNIKRLTTCMQKIYPVRVKKINVYNPPPYMEAVMTIFKTFMKPKLRERFEIHKSLATVYENVEESVFPEEYLPDDFTGPNSGTLASITDSMLEGMNKPEVVEYIKNVSTYKADINRKPNEAEPAASFRKLNVD